MSSYNVLLLSRAACYSAAMPRPNPLTPEVLAAFLAELRRGTLVVAAAASVGVAVQTLYRRRGRDPGFDEAWTEAAEASLIWSWDPRLQRKVRAPGCRRRLRFAAARRRDFLRRLERDCNSTAAARDIGFHPSTVVQALRRDRAFALDNQAALERGYVRLERLAALERERAAARMRRFLDRGFEPTGEPTADFDRQLRLLDRYRRREQPARGLGRRARRALSRAESVEALERKLAHLDLGSWGDP